MPELVPICTLENAFDLLNLGETAMHGADVKGENVWISGTHGRRMASPIRILSHNHIDLLHGLWQYDCNAIDSWPAAGIDLERKGMASITIRNLDDEVKSRLRVQAAGHGRSMEEEARRILRDAVGRRPSSRNLVSIIRSHFGPDSGVDLELPAREPGREPPSFD